MFESRISPQADAAFFLLLARLGISIDPQRELATDLYKSTNGNKSFEFVPILP